MKSNNFGLFSREIIEVTAAVDDSVAKKKLPKKPQQAKEVNDYEDYDTYESPYASKPKQKKQVAKQPAQKKKVVLDDEYMPSEDLLKVAMEKRKNNNQKTSTVYDEFPIDDMYDDDDGMIDDIMPEPAPAPAPRRRSRPQNAYEQEYNKHIAQEDTSAKMAEALASLGLDKLPSMLAEIGDIKRQLSEMKTTMSDNVVIDLSSQLKDYHTKMVKNGADDVIAYRALKNIERHLTSDMSNAQIRSVITEVLAQMITLESDFLNVMKNKVLAFAGPTGVGKTTTIAKIAATMTLKHRLNVCLITLDNFRIGAVEQLKTYAEIVKIPLYVASSPGELRKILQEVRKAYDCVLIDSMGRSQYDVTQISNIKEFVSISDDISVALVLSMASNPLEMFDIVERYSELVPDYLVFTKLDETKYFGSLLNIPVKKRIPLLLFTTGQNVPDDMESPNGKKIAKKLLQDIPSVWNSK